MNTKQLWCALSLNAKTSVFFDGIYSKDTLNENPALSYVTLIHQINLESTGFFFSVMRMDL